MEHPVEQKNFKEAVVHLKAAIKNLERTSIVEVRTLRAELVEGLSEDERLALSFVSSLLGQSR